MTSVNNPDFSLIIPVYNSANFIAHSIKNLIAITSGHKIVYEIIFVDDGSTDNTVEVIKTHANLANIKLVELKENQGKFAAIAKGVEHVTGKYAAFTDADLPYDLSALPYMYSLMSSNVIHFVLGDRRLSQSESQIPNTWLRKLASLTLSTIIRLLMTGGLHDSQCGLKGFRADIAKATFPLLRFRRFAGDIELLYIALKYNLTIKRIPVKLVNSAPTTVRLQLDFLGFLHCIFSMRINWDLGRYNSEQLSKISNERYWQS